MASLFGKIGSQMSSEEKPRAYRTMTTKIMGHALQIQPAAVAK